MGSGFSRVRIAIVPDAKSVIGAQDFCPLIQWTVGPIKKQTDIPAVQLFYKNMGKDFHAVLQLMDNFLVAHAHAGSR